MIDETPREPAMRTVAFFLLLLALGATATAQDPSFNLTNRFMALPT